MKRKIETGGAPKAIGPYSAAIETNGLLFLSGQLPIDAATGAMPDGVASQTEVSLKNVLALLENAGRTADDVIKATVYLVDMDDFAVVNEIYSGVFHEPYPARTCVEVRRLPKNAKVEIEVIAV